MALPPSSLSSTQIALFYQQGYLHLEIFFSLHEVAEMSTAIAHLQEMAQSLEGKVMHQGSQFVVDKGIIRRVVWAGAAEPVLLKYGRDPRLTSIAAEILGSDHADHLINQVHFKLPQDGVFYPWHQDIYHRKKDTIWTDVNGRGSFVQLLTAIDEAALDNGPLYCIPGSCREGDLDLPYNETKQTISDKFDPAEAVPVLMRPGDLAVFGPYTVHGSYDNTSGKSRRAFINGYASSGANRKVYPGEGAGELVKLR
ncbi:MAG: phytanoyl-CoA dioxygenase family protein [Nanoarchaeota archaeon]|nr:phytanoyl-CoA dioxygenase family protein [Nanoarchaeota archaeon]